MGSVRVLLEDEQRVVDILKEEGIFQKITEDCICVGKEESTAVLCSDDHTDMTDHHREIITPTVHPVRFFGGPLAFCPGYKDYDPSSVRWILRNIRKGMSLKGNNDLCVYFHFACGMADNYNHKMMDILGWIPQVRDFFVGLDFMKGKETHILGHTRKKDEQNSYIIEVSKLDHFISSGGLKNV